MSLLRVVVTLMVIASPSLAIYGSLRITDGGDSGRLEFQDDSGVWGTVCSNGFGDDAAYVACSQLGYHRAKDVLRNKDYPSRGLPINICGTSCDGDEDRLIYCTLTPCGTVPSCEHSQDIGISCTGVSFFFIFIIGSFIGCCIIRRCPFYYKKVHVPPFCCCCCCCKTQDTAPYEPVRYEHETVTTTTTRIFPSAPSYNTINDEPPPPYTKY
ncbi:egg peptide speract receptor-like isoform X2 [Dysidea avara]|uniref:egg peptide speract receptor-like isoform X2 n=1 Tax=Dysidea avara TaxID=196820 RepID=UPI0033282605